MHIKSIYTHIKSLFWQKKNKTSQPIPLLPQAPSDTAALPSTPNYTQNAVQISSDRPGKTLGDDQYDIKEIFIPRLTKIALDWPDQDGLVIGLFGPWGIGKTTILNMLRDHAKNHLKLRPHVKFVTFNPWFYEDTGSLAMAFFATIATELSVDQEKPWARAGNALKAMGIFLTVASKGVTVFGLNVDAEKVQKASAIAAKALDQTVDLSNGLAGVADLAGSGQKKLDEHKKTVETGLVALGASGGRLIIELDDIDRLNKSELLSLLKLVRIVADLPFITLIIAMDDKRVRDVLEGSTSEGYGKSYLDKIVQVPLHIPIPSTSAIRAKISREIELILSIAKQSQPQELASQWQWSHDDPLTLLASTMSTPRDLTRYANSLRTLFLAGSDPDVDVIDAILLDALRLFHPDVYDRIRRNKSFLTEILLLNDEPDSAIESGTSERSVARAARLDVIVSGTNNATDPETIETVRAILKRMFGDVTKPDHARDYEAEEANRKIKSRRSFDNYFRHAPLIGSLTRTQIRGMCEKVLELSKLGRTREAESVLVVELNGRPLVDTLPISDEMAHWFSGISPSEFSFISSVFLALARQLPTEFIVRMISRLLGIATNSAYGPNQTWTTPELESRFQDLIGFASSSKLTIIEVCELINRASRSTVEAHMISSSVPWLKAVVEQLRTADPFSLADPGSVHGALLFAASAINTLGANSPISKEDYASELLGYAERVPERVPHLIGMAGYSGSKGFGLLSMSRPTAEVIASLSEIFMDTVRLKAAFEQFKASGFEAGEMSAVVSQFSKLLNDQAL
ncbi:KAP family P-loop NTPase fold protein [Corallococcus exiguus]|uniref:KAP family P-loop NTPase fold protein n=1 Tax=Corallococcus exiguus TaxID=83462 RepID=UPI00156055B2|nr:P-loop NTPase fold protein [Corallococcus exiguus]NRD47316.1 hypothetical protein [Corallococcus exiguus]